MAQPKRIRTVEGSCWNCKNRRVKCDLKKPCSKCTSGNIACSYGKKIRYKIFEPLNLQKNKRKITTKPVEEPKKVPEIQASTFQAEKRLTLGNEPSLEFTSDQQLMYFERILSPKLTVYGDSMKIENSFIFQDPLLSIFIGAISSAHKMIGSGDDSSISVVNSSRSSAISEFRQNMIKLSDGNINVLFTGNVFLCLLDGVVYPKDDYTMASLHLQGGRAILNSIGNVERQLEVLDDSISIMMLSYFGTIDLINCIVTGLCPHFPKEFWFHFGDKIAWWGNISRNNSFLEILSVLADIAGSALEMTPMSLERLLSFHSFFERKRRQRNSCDNNWEIFCSAFSLTGVIYLYRKICGFEKKSPLVQLAVTECVSNISELQDSELQHCLLFPLLIIGSHCIVPEHQELIRQSVIKSYSHLNFGSVRVLWKFLEEVWFGSTIPSRTWCEEFTEISKTVFLF